MRKKGEKVVLKSDIFKTKTPEKTAHTPSRSPISRSPYVSKREDDRVDPNDLFQKVCCPNCRFIFKIIKQAEAISSYSRKRDRPSAQATQTDQSFIKEAAEIKSLAIELNKKLPQRNESLLGKNLQLRTEMSQITEQPSEGELIDQSIRVSEALPAPARTNNNQNPNSNNPNTLANPSNMASSSNLNRPSMKSSIKMGQKHSSQTSFMQQSRVARSQQELKQMLGRFYLKGKANELLNGLLLELPASVECPAYHKMLLQEELRLDAKH